MKEDSRKSQPSRQRVICMFHVILMWLAVDVDGSGLSRSGENRVSDLEHDARAIRRGHEWIRRWPGLEIPLGADSSFQSPHLCVCCRNCCGMDSDEDGTSLERKGSDGGALTSGNRRSIDRPSSTSKWRDRRWE